MRVHVAAAVAFSLLFAGCTSSTGGTDPGSDEDHDDLGLEVVPVFFLNLTIGNDTHRFSTASAGPAGPGANASSSSTTTITSGNATGSGNSTSGNSTAGAGSGQPGGEAPLDVTATLGASRLPANRSVSWTLDFGDADTGNATAGNGTAAGPTNGTRVPATVEHTYTSAGTYGVSVSFQVGNGTRQVLRATVAVAGGNATPTAAGPLPEPIVIEGSSFGLLGEGSADETFDLVGSAATMTITLEYSGLSGEDDLDWSIAGPGGESGGGENSGPEDPATFDDPTEGTWTVTIIPYLTVGPVDYTITVTFA